MRIVLIIISFWVILLFSQCKKEPQQTVLQGRYIGVMTGSYKKMDIKNFDSNPDTTYSNDAFDIEDVELIIDGFKYQYSYFSKVQFGTIVLEGDEVTFKQDSSNCPVLDCANFLAGEKLQFQLIEPTLKMTFAPPVFERQYNATDKDFTTEKRVYILERVE